MKAQTIGWIWVAVQAALLGALAFAPTQPALHAGLPWCWTIVGAAAVLAYLAWRDLGDALTPNPVPRADTHLRVHGIYRLVRHPMYAAVVLGAIGWAGVRGGVGHWLLVTTLVVFFLLKIRHEERWLVARYADYAAYRARTGMLWPRFGNRDR